MAKNKTLEIVRAISRAAGEKGHDGALDAEGEPVKTGLSREEGNPITDTRVMDGFGIKFCGNKLIVTYQSEYLMKDVSDSSFENDIESKIEDVVKFLKKEARKHTDESITLSPEAKSFNVMVQTVSNVRTWVEAKKDYTIGGIDAIDKASNNNKKEDDKIRKFLELSAGEKRPKNEKIKAKDNEREELKENLDLAAEKLSGKYGKSKLGKIKRALIKTQRYIDQGGTARIGYVEDAVARILGSNVRGTNAPLARDIIDYVFRKNKIREELKESLNVNLFQRR